MSDLPKSIEICEKGPREGLQSSPARLRTVDKIALIDALSQTGLRDIQIVSFVNPKRVPGWADADTVVAGIHAREGVRYTGLYLNEKGLERAIAHKGRLSFKEAILLSASEKFMIRNQNCDFARNDEIQHGIVAVLKQNNLPVESALIQAAFGCNFEGDIFFAAADDDGPTWNGYCRGPWVRAQASIAE